MWHRGALSGWDGWDGWISPGGVRYRAHAVLTRAPGAVQLDDDLGDLDDKSTDSGPLDNKGTR